MYDAVVVKEFTVIWRQIFILTVFATFFVCHKGNNSYKNIIIESNPECVKGLLMFFSVI